MGVWVWVCVCVCVCVCVSVCEEDGVYSLKHIKQTSVLIAYSWRAHSRKVSVISPLSPHIHTINVDEQWKASL